MIHDTQSSEITVTLEGELADVTDAELELLEAFLGELIQTMLLSQEEEG